MVRDSPMELQAVQREPVELVEQVLGPVAAQRPLAQADASLDDLRAGRVRGRVVLVP